MIADALGTTDRYLRELAEAFGRGCDARLAAEPFDDNPYDLWGKDWERWREGWMDVNDNWALLAKGPYRRLPPVTGGAS